MKIIYVAECLRIYGDCFELKFSFDKDEAIMAAIADRKHLTSSERNNSTHSVKGYLMDVESGESAKEAYDRAFEDGCCNPDEYYEITIKEDEEN